MADPISVLATLGTVAKTLYTLAQTAQQNREECKRLVSHTENLCEQLWVVCGENVPEGLLLKAQALAQ